LYSPSSISWAWNVGSMLACCLGVQLVSGLVLARGFCVSTELAFSSVDSLTREMWYGWLFRFIHANGASLFMACLFAHLARGLYYNGYRSVDV